MFILLFVFQGFIIANFAPKSKQKIRLAFCAKPCYNLFTLLYLLKEKGRNIMAFCEFCGKQAGDNDNNCTACGAAIATAAAPAAAPPNQWAQPPAQPWQQPQPQQPWQQPVQQDNSGKIMAGVGLGLGLFALIIPIPFLDVVAGIVGIILAAMSRKKGSKGLGVAALVISIIGLLAAIGYTAMYL